MLEDLLAPLEEGALDLLIAARRVPRRSIAYQALYREEFVLVGASVWAGRLAYGRQRLLEAIAAAPLLAYAEELPIIRRYFRLAFGTQAERKAVIVIPDLRSLMLAAAGGAGITVLPRYLCEKMLDSGELVQLYQPDQPVANTVYLAWNRQALHTPRIAYTQQTILNRLNIS